MNREKERERESECQNKFKTNLETGGSGGQMKNILLWAPNDVSLQTMKPKSNPFTYTLSVAAL